ncbi:ubiquitin domain-containing protein 1-like [Cucumis melo var. makuwa]|uniref:Ubiquitin domain-containing protein 1-like n=1 Tax=Cucumis melo var. makuwa TaxID=1194695 RepID=A0A5D3DVZ1_CUCMM|nr:ubiquitin domain-containing protein 1-like [Cucumis melo var. makuwa]TYK27906.1 ubiquitin domain-containing protein 1-like [Cucumis melo var. makuwa]
MNVLCSVHIKAETIKKNLILWALEIWDALRAAAEADLTLAQAIVDSAGIIVQSADLTICYDERGAKYELPKYVLSEPTNLI